MTFSSSLLLSSKKSLLENRGSVLFCDISREMIGWEINPFCILSITHLHGCYVASVMRWRGVAWRGVVLDIYSFRWIFSQAILGQMKTRFQAECCVIGILSSFIAFISFLHVSKFIVLSGCSMFRSALPKSTIHHSTVIGTSQIFIINKFVRKTFFGLQTAQNVILYLKILPLDIPHDKKSVQ